MMKVLLVRSLLLLLLLFGMQPTFSQSQNYSNWAIASGDLSGGRVVMTAGQTRTLAYTVTIVRFLQANGGPNDWQSVNFNFQLMRMPSGSASCGCTAISSVQSITSSDFASGQNTVTKTYTVQVTAQSGSSLTGSTLRNNDQIILAVGTSSGNWSPSKSFGVTVNTPSIPSAPRSLATSAGASCKVSLSWAAPTSGTPAPSAYRVYVNNQYYQEVAATSTTVFGLVQNTAYSFKVTAVNPLGEGPASASVNYTTTSDPAGTSMSNPINVTLSPQQYYYDTRSNVTANCYRNDLVANAGNEYTGQPSDDIYYKFSTQYYGELQISLCGSPFTNTRIHLLSYDGTWIHRDDDKYPLCASAQTSRVEDIEPGTYYVVIEGENADAGQYNLSIILDTRYVVGSDWYIPVDIGELGSCSSFYDNWQWINPTFKDNYGYDGDDVYYKFTLTTASNIVIASCSDIHSFVVHLLDENNQHLMIGDPDPCYISTYLQAGNYNVVLEGEPDSYPFAYNLPFSIWTTGCSGKMASTITATVALAAQANALAETVTSVYPVPANDILTVNPGVDADYQVVIVDALGNTLKSLNNLKGISSVNVQDLKNGVYMVRVILPTSTVVRRIEIVR